jgi:hypothetical protein
MTVKADLEEDYADNSWIELFRTVSSTSFVCVCVCERERERETWRRKVMPMQTELNSFRLEVI